MIRHILTFVLVVCWCVLDAPSGNQRAAAQVTDSTLREPQAGDWVTHGLNYAETRFGPLSQINVNNVARLGLEWAFEFGRVGAVRATPLVHGGVMYGSYADGQLFAVDARTGTPKWRWDPAIPATAFQRDAEGNQLRGPDGQPIRIGPLVCCVRANRGVALYDGKVYVGLLDGRLVALHAESGAIAWQVQSADYRRDYSITIAPRVVKGKVIIGNSGADFGVRAVRLILHADAPVDVRARWQEGNATLESVNATA